MYKNLDFGGSNKRMELIQEHKGFFTPIQRDKIVKRLHENDKTKFCIYFRTDDDLDIDIKKDKRFSIMSYKPDYYYSRPKLPQNKFPDTFHFKHFGVKEFSRYIAISITKGEIPGHPNKVLGPPDKYDRRVMHTFPSLVERTPNWTKAKIKLSIKYITNLDKKERRNERIRGAFLGAVFGAVLSSVLSYIIVWLKS